MGGKRVLVLSASLFLGAALAVCWAEGGGGFFSGRQGSSAALPLPGSSPGLFLTGGYGYGVSGHRVRGGFGVGLSGGPDQPRTGGGYGGVIQGARWELGPFDFMLTSWTGIGGLRLGASGGESPAYLILSEELDLEIGLAVLPWFMPVLYAGYQVMGNVAPGRPFGELFSYAPVIGLRFAFGRF